MNIEFWDMKVHNFVLIVLIIAGAILFDRMLRIFLDKFFKSSSEHLKVDVTRYAFFKNALTFIIFTIASITIIYTIPSLRSLALTLFAGAGIFAAIIGFASQQAFSNIVSGIFIVIFKPFRVGDVLLIGSDMRGTVEDITLRHTVIRDFENRRIIIPNTVISGQTIINANIEDQRIRKMMDFGISYDSDVDKAIEIIQEEAVNHPLCLDVRTPEEKENGTPIVPVRLVGFGDSSVNLRAWVWAEDPGKAFEMHCDLNKSIKERFDREGIEIPFPYRTIVFKNSNSSENPQIP